jgi:hypothetical protein
LSDIGSTFFKIVAQWVNQGSRRTVSVVLGRLQDRRGEPSLRTRAMAALVILGLIVLTAPLVVVPIVGWVAHHLL